MVQDWNDTSPSPSLSLPHYEHTHTLDKLDAVGAFLKRKRLHSELEEEEDDEELSLLEYLRRRDERPSRAGSSGKKKKQVRESKHYLCNHVAQKTCRVLLGLACDLSAISLVPRLSLRCPIPSRRMHAFIASDDL